MIGGPDAEEAMAATDLLLTGERWEEERREEAIRQFRDDAAVDDCGARARARRRWRVAAAAEGEAHISWGKMG